MGNTSLPHGAGNFSDDSSRRLIDEATLKKFRIRMQALIRTRGRPGKPTPTKGPGADELVEKAISRAWGRLAEFKGSTHEEFKAWLFRILDDVVDEAYPV
jgi:DNA-directed RNA polymerase specialized sigma24 family protein